MEKFQAPNGATVRIDPTPDAMAAAFADDLLNAINVRLADVPFFSLALTGGKTPAPMYRKLLEARCVRGADWKRVKVFFGDERTVPPDHPDSNYRMAWEAWLREGPVPGANIHRMRGEGLGQKRGEATGDLAAAAENYAAILQRELPSGASGLPALDLILLGMGDDGHIASLFPGTAALNENQALVAANVVPQHNTTRLTLTFPAINAAREIWMIVAGAAKAERVVEALGWRPGGEALPVSRVRPATGQTLWRLDPGAAGLTPLSPRK